MCVVLAAAGGCDAVDTGSDTGTTAAPLVVAANGIPKSSRWTFWDRGGDINDDLPTDWKANNFQDGAWSSGIGPLGYGENYLYTVVSYGPDVNAKHPTTFFRAQFTLGDPAQVTRITGSLMYDDGVVIYLNGHEISRKGVAAPSTGYTYASGHEAGNAYETIDLTAAKQYLLYDLNTIAVEVHQQSPSSSDLVFDLGLALQFAPPPGPTAGGIPRAARWSYWDRGGDLGSAWRAAAYDDASWSEGRSPLGYGESYLNTTIGYGPNASAKYITSYFRHDFTVDNPALVTAIAAELMYDDGLVVYLNGHEIGRQGVATPTTASTPASGHEAGNAYETYDWTAQRVHLVAGVNTIAVEVHQQSGSSSDLAFDLALTVTASAPPPEAITRRSTWKYWDRGGDLGSNWRARTFADLGWTTGAGPLGYGEPYVATTIGYGPSASAKYITSYFRRHFTVADPAAVTAISAELMYDDGVVVYINGTEVKRLHMPAGAITASTLAPGWETGNVYEPYDLTAARALLVAGDNVIAVEVHQAAASSSDLTFDLALTLTAGACASAATGDWAGTADRAYFGAGATDESYAEVTWAFSRSDGCVDHYTPSGTAYDRSGAHYCQEVEPTSAPIEPGDGELVIDRSTNPPSYTMHGNSRWPAKVGCIHPGPDDEEDWVYGTAGSEWAVDIAGTFDANVMSGGHDGGGHAFDWTFTRVAASFPPPAAGACAEPTAAGWVTTSARLATDRADLTWSLVSTTGCVDTYQPSGTAHVGTKTDDRINADCRVRRWVPDSAPVAAGDGQLRIDRSTNPPTFRLNGGTGWDADQICEHRDGTVSHSNGAYVQWGANFFGAYQGNRWSGMSEGMYWSFRRQ